jgi:hypothetical protein
MTAHQYFFCIIYKISHNYTLRHYVKALITTHSDSMGLELDAVEGDETNLPEKDRFSGCFRSITAKKTNSTTAVSIRMETSILRRMVLAYHNRDAISQ